MSLIKTLRDSLNNIIYPATHAKAVYVEKDGTHETLQEYIDESGSGGHTIEDTDGNTMTARSNLQFSGMSVTDDSTNDRTKVKLPIFNGTTAQWEDLSSTEKAKYSVVNLTDDYGAETLLYTITNQLNGSTVVTQDVQNLSIDTSPYKKLLLEIILLNASDKPYYLVCNVYFCLDHFLGTVAEASGAPQIIIHSSANTENFGFVSFQNTSNPRIITRVHLESKWSTLTNKMQMKVYGIK